MTTKTPAQLTVSTTVDDADLYVGYPPGGPMYGITAANLRIAMESTSLILDGSKTMTGPVVGEVGSEGAPAYTFTGDSDTGIYRVGANTLGIAAGGLVRVQFDASGATAMNGGAFIGPLTGNVTGNAATATKWATGRTITLTGDVTGVSGAIDGSGNGSMATVGVQAAKWTTARNLSLTGDVTATLASVDGSGAVSAAATLANTAVTPASYTNTNLTVDSKGRITAASNGTIGALTLQSKSGNYTVGLTDANNAFLFTATATFTIPVHGTTNFDVGTTFRVLNGAGANVTISVGASDVLIWSPGGTTGSRTLAAGGWADLIKSTTSSWYISGFGLT